MDTLYPTTATTNDTRGPALRRFEYVVIPPIRLVLDAILEHCAVGGSIAPGIRQLGEWSGVTLGLITDCLRTLDAEGIIAYDGRVIMLRFNPDEEERDRSGDRSGCEDRQDVIDQVIDQPEEDGRQRDRSGDRSVFRAAVDRAMMRQSSHEPPDRSPDRSAASDSHPPQTPPMVIHDSAAAESAAAHESLPRGGMQGGGVPDRSADRSAVALLLAELGCDDAALRAEILERHPLLSTGELLEQWELAQDRERDGYTPNARALLFGTLRKGQRLYGRATERARPVAASDLPPPSDPDEQALAAAHRRARALAPPGLPHALMTDLIYAILDGASDDQVLDLLAVPRPGGAP